MIVLHDTGNTILNIHWVFQGVIRGIGRQGSMQRYALSSCVACIESRNLPVNIEICNVKKTTTILELVRHCVRKLEISTSYNQPGDLCLAGRNVDIIDVAEQHDLAK